jgi:hypothetical protein
MSENLLKYFLQMVTTGMFLCFTKNSTVELYYRMEVYLHAFFTTHRMEIWRYLQGSMVIFPQNQAPLSCECVEWQRGK